MKKELDVCEMCRPTFPCENGSELKWNLRDERKSGTYGMTERMLSNARRQRGCVLN